ncbi:hypothetical protein [Kitasatospora sp. McL0602]|uniref:hypothetical protein n=1 Tax=Kitasatospora sp. McL0602 TaxID=3439530 RepID=UPI003F8C3EC5
MSWEGWAARCTASRRLTAATEASQEYWPVLRADRFRRIREHDPEFAEQLEQTLGDKQ